MWCVVCSRWRSVQRQVLCFDWPTRRAHARTACHAHARLCASFRPYDLCTQVMDATAKPDGLSASKPRVRASAPKADNPPSQRHIAKAAPAATGKSKAAVQPSSQTPSTAPAVDAQSSTADKTPGSRADKTPGNKSAKKHQSKASNPSAPQTAPSEKKLVGLGGYLASVTPVFTPDSGSRPCLPFTEYSNSCIRRAASCLLHEVPRSSCGRLPQASVRGI